MELLRRFGPFDVQEKLGDGGTGVVLRCIHRETGLSAAVKVPKTQATSAREALRREIGILGRLRRAQIRGVVPLLEHGGGEDVPWYAMELLQGHSLRHWQQRLWNGARPATSPFETPLTQTTDVSLVAALEPEWPRPSAMAEVPRIAAAQPAAAGQLERVLRVFLRMAEILVQLHAEGVVHGDLTPANVVFRDETDPVLIDFGAALSELGLDSWKEVPSYGPEARGTAGYLAPELIAGETIDARCDLYALGCILYEALTGHSAFSGSRARDVLRQQLHHTPPAAASCVSGLPAQLDQLVSALLEKDPRRRVSRAEDVCDVLRRCMLGRPRALSARNAPLLYRARLFGRGGALAQLEEQLDAALIGQGGLALVGGESGIGKTRLLNELGKRAARLDMPVIWARASEDVIGKGVPAGPLELFAPVLEALLEREPGVAAIGGEDARADFQMLGAVVTRLGARTGVLDTVELAPEVLVRRAFEALQRLLAGAANTAGLLVLIDDLQWSDQLSLQFVESCAERLAGSRVLLVANYRTGELGERAEALARGATCRLALSQLDAPDTRAMVADLLASDAIPEGLLEFLAQHADGNPFFVGEYTRAALAQGLLQRQPGGHWQFERERAAELDVPQSIAGLFQLRVRQLSERARDALQLASILERDFDADAFAALLGPQIDCAEVLEELVAREVFTPSAPGRYRFVHDKLREAQSGALEPGERTRHHVRVAQHLERTAGRGEIAMAADAEAAAGYHWACAGEPERALTHLAPAATAAAHSGHALDRAAQLFRLALRQCEQLPDAASGSSQRRLLREQLADVLVRQARHPEARACLQALLADLDAHDRVARARAWRKTASTHWVVHDYDAAARALDRAESELGVPHESDSTECWSERIQIRLGRFEQLYFAGKLGQELDALMRELEPSIERYGTPDQACVYYFTSASYAMLLKRYAFDPHAVVLAERGLAAARTLPAGRLALAHFILAYTLALGTIEHCRSALAHFEQALEHAQRTGDATLLSRILTYHAIALLRSGDVERTAAAARIALDAAQNAQLAPYVAAAQYCQGWVAWRQEDCASAEALLQTARASWRNHPHKFPFQSLAAFPLIDAAHVRDDFGAIRELLAEVQAGLPSFPGELSAAIATAENAIDSAAAARASKAVAEVVRLARVLAFA